jgi:hypothetical protein
MPKQKNEPNRRTFLGTALVLPAFAAISQVAARADSSKASQESMHYQTTPNGSMQCSGCKFFNPGKDASSDGTCQVVDGTISPHGYCIAYSAKS